MSRLTKIGARMLVIAVAGSIAVLAIGMLSLSRLSDARYEDRRAGTQHVVETGLGVLEHFGELEAAGELDRETAQSMALGVVKQLRYGDGDYFWVHDSDLVMQMHAAKPELDGTDVSGIEDPDGVLVFQAFDEVIRRDGAGFVEYQWPKAGEDAPQPKISYVAEYEPWGWTIGSGVYVDDIETALASDRTILLGFVALTAALLVGLVLLVRRSITRPLAEMTDVLVEGDITRRLDEGDGVTEIDQLAAAVNGNLERVGAVVQQVVDAAESVSAQVEQLNEHVAAIEEQAGRTADQANGAAASTQSAIAGYGELAMAIGEFESSVQTIAQSVHRVASVANDAAHATDQSSDVLNRLGSSSKEIGEVLQTITEIAEQTNLLALNATIEAARAGEAGKGFAVVADEVKGLAQQTADATERVAQRIHALQTDAAESVEAIARIAEIIEQVNELQSGIASAVEEQTTTMSNVTDTVERSQDSGADAGAAITRVADSSAETRGQLDHVTESVEALREVSEHLQLSVAGFRH